MNAHHAHVLSRVMRNECAVALPNELLVLHFRRGGNGRAECVFVERDWSDSPLQPHAGSKAAATALAQEAMDKAGESDDH